MADRARTGRSSSRTLRLVDELTPAEEAFATWLAETALRKWQRTREVQPEPETGYRSGDDGARNR